MNHQKLSMLVMSDSHFYSPLDKNAELLFKFINNLDCESLEYFVLLGDIFDFCFGTSTYFKQKFMPFSEAFLRLHQKGVKVIYLQGNHEFSLNDINWNHVKIIEDFSYQISLKCGEKFVFTHGDRLMAPRSYFWYLAITRSKIFSFIAKFLPQKKLDQLALSISKKSRKKDVYRTLNHENVLEKANLWVENFPNHHGVFGHFHYPYFQKRRIGNEFLMSMDSWFKPNFLAYSQEGFSRIYLKENQNEIFTLKT